MDLQAVAFATVNDPAVPAHIKAAHMRAWVDLEEIRMALRGQGKPKPVDARNGIRKPRGSQSVTPIAPASAPTNLTTYTAKDNGT